MVRMNYRMELQRACNSSDPWVLIAKIFHINLAVNVWHRNDKSTALAVNNLSTFLEIFPYSKLLRVSVSVYAAIAIHRIYRRCRNAPSRRWGGTRKIDTSVFWHRRRSRTRGGSASRCRTRRTSAPRSTTTSPATFSPRRPSRPTAWGDRTSRSPAGTRAWAPPSSSSFATPNTSRWSTSRQERLVHIIMTLLRRSEYFFLRTCVDFDHGQSVDLCWCPKSVFHSLNTKYQVLWCCLSIYNYMYSILRGSESQHTGSTHGQPVIYKISSFLVLSVGSRIPNTGRLNVKMHLSNSMYLITSLQTHIKASGISKYLCLKRIYI